MSITLSPYLSFKGTAREALEFYRSVLGGELTVMTFAEGGMPVAPSEEGFVMHGQLTTPNGLTLMGADTPDGMSFVPGDTVTVSLSGTDSDLLAAFWEGLTVGAEVGMPFEVAPWGDRFGMFTDRYGIGWMINAAASSA